MLSEVKVAGLVKDPFQDTWIVMLEEKEGKRVLPIWIGQFEAQAILMEMGHKTPPRPLTHDLIKSLLIALDAIVEHIVVCDLVGSTFYAKLHVQKDGKTFEVDARPSDSVALALRFQAPIYVDAKVIDQAGLESPKGLVKESRKESDTWSDTWIDDMFRDLEGKEKGKEE
jgi:bifunctional DNase/RNase